MDKILFDALQVRFVKLRFTVAFSEDSVLPKNKVSDIRGGMGEMLIRLNCVRDRQCEGCDLKTECIAHKIMYSEFERKPDFVTTGGSIGYILECGNYKDNFKAGDKLNFHLILFGKTIAYFYQFYQAISVLGRQEGIGRYHAKFRIVGIRNMEGMSILERNSVNMDKFVVHTIYDYVLFRKLRHNISKKECKIIFDTPLALKYQNEFLREYQIEPIITAIKRRIYLLDCFEGIECDILHQNEITIMPQIIEQEYRQVGVSRHFMQKNVRIVLNGLKGYALLSNLTEGTMALLLVGELLHIGKNTGFGFGRFHIGGENQRFHNN